MVEPMKLLVEKKTRGRAGRNVSTTIKQLFQLVNLGRVRHQDVHRHKLSGSSSILSPWLFAPSVIIIIFSHSTWILFPHSSWIFLLRRTFSPLTNFCALPLLKHFSKALFRQLSICAWLAQNSELHLRSSEHELTSWRILNNCSSWHRLVENPAACSTNVDEARTKITRRRSETIVQVEQGSCYYQFSFELLFWQLVADWLANGFMKLKRNRDGRIERQPVAPTLAPTTMPGDSAMDGWWWSQRRKKQLRRNSSDWKMGVPAQPLPPVWAVGRLRGGKSKSSRTQDDATLDNCCKTLTRFSSFWLGYKSDLRKSCVQNVLSRDEHSAAVIDSNQYS